MDNINQAPDATPEIDFTEDNLTPLYRSRWWAIILGSTSIFYFILHLVGFLFGLYYVTQFPELVPVTTLVWLVLSTVIFSVFLFIGTSLVKFGRCTTALSMYPSIQTLENTLHAQSRFWKFVGIAAIILILVLLANMGIFIAGYYLGRHA